MRTSTTRPEFRRGKLNSCLERQVEFRSFELALTLEPALLTKSIEMRMDDICEDLLRAGGGPQDKTLC